LGSSLHWAWVKGWERRRGRLGLFVQFAFTVIGATLAAIAFPQGVTVVSATVDTVGRGIIGAAVGLLGSWLFLLCISLWRAPYEQLDSVRNEALARRARGLEFGRAVRHLIERPTIPATEELWVVEVFSKGDKTLDDVEVVLRAVDPDLPTIRKERLLVWHDHRSQDAQTSIPPGKSVTFAVTHQDWSPGIEPTRWNFRYANGDTNPPLPLEPRKIELAAYGRDVDPVFAHFSVEIGQRGRVALHRLNGAVS
jgi:hypothetical protein